MAEPVQVRRLGNQMVVDLDDDTQLIFVPTGNGRWLAASNYDGGDDSEIGEGGGPGTGDDSDDDASPGDLYNPWKSVPISQSWESHIQTAGRGGIDYPLAYGTAIKAPAAGTLHTSGGSGEYAAGQVGSAGRRSILYLDKTFSRTKPKGSVEAAGPMRAIVFQHQSQFGAAKHYNRGEVLGYSGASANGSDYGGDVHLHVHGLDRGGSRLDFLKFIP